MLTGVYCGHLLPACWEYLSPPLPRGVGFRGLTLVTRTVLIKFSTKWGFGYVGVIGSYDSSVGLWFVDFVCWRSQVFANEATLSACTQCALSQQANWLARALRRLKDALRPAERVECLLFLVDTCLLSFLCFLFTERWLSWHWLTRGRLSARVAGAKRTSKLAHPPPPLGG
jgi:hypothetical protein